ncbi:hypothetical protein WJX81_004803 [Elliptochloris bilobata]|uniref:Uncharacterized protein n=1 Tax=Elliptochloris bilobata TaxID=381761 RepID=A0AAW1S256_9CHLO
MMAGTLDEPILQPERRRGDRRKRSSTRWGPDDAEAELPAAEAAVAAEAGPVQEGRPRKRPKRTRWGPDDLAAAGDAEDGGEAATTGVQQAVAAHQAAAAPAAVPALAVAAAVPHLNGAVDQAAGIAPPTANDHGAASVPDDGPVDPFGLLGLPSGPPGEEEGAAVPPYAAAAAYGAYGQPSAAGASLTDAWATYYAAQAAAAQMVAQVDAAAATASAAPLPSSAAPSSAPPTSAPPASGAGGTSGGPSVADAYAAWAAERAAAAGTKEAARKAAKAAKPPPRVQVVPLPIAPPEVAVKENVLSEAGMIIPDTRSRVEAALQDLGAYVDAVGAQAKAADEFKAAEEAIANSQKALGDS